MWQINFKHDLFLWVPALRAAHTLTGDYWYILWTHVVLASYSYRWDSVQCSVTVLCTLPYTIAYNVSVCVCVCVCVCVEIRYAVCGVSAELNWHLHSFPGILWSEQYRTKLNILIMCCMHALYGDRESLAVTSYIPQSRVMYPISPFQPKLLSLIKRGIYRH